MNRKRWLWLLALVPLLFAAFMAGRSSRASFIPELYVVGDVAHSLVFTDLSAWDGLASVSADGATYQGLTLAQVVSAAEPMADITSLVLVAADGFSVQLAGDSLAACRLTFTAESGWCVIAPYHPLSANATRLQRLIVVAEQSRDTSVLVTAAGGGQTFTIGQLYAAATLSYPYPEGTAEKDTDGKTYTATVFTRRDCLTLSQLGCKKTAVVEIIAANGESRCLTAAEGPLFQLAGNQLDYIDAAGRDSLRNIKQIMITD